MSSTRTKTFSISDIIDLEKVDSWWAGLLRNGAKQICGVEWVPKGDLSWALKMHWEPIDGANLPFNICMPAYATYSLEDLSSMLSEIESERTSILFHLRLLKTKVEEWGLVEIEGHDGVMSDEVTTSHDIPVLAEHLVDPFLSYGPKLDLVDKIMASEFLWPSYKNMKRGLLMLDAKIEEITKEIEHRSDSSYTVVHVDRGMLRGSFADQIGYDNKWLFATDEELMSDEIPEDDDNY